MRWPDTVTIATAFLALLILIPAQLVYAPMGGVGKPAVLVALFGGFVWVLSRLVRGRAPGDRQPVRLALYAYTLVLLLTYILGQARGLPGAEALAADRELIFTAAIVGIGLYVCDLVTTRDDLDVLLRRLVGITTVMAVVGILQFRPGIDLTQWIEIPGLTYNRELTTIGTRGTPGFIRIQGTAMHPIEFGVVLSMVLPLAVHYALFADDRRSRTRWWVLTGLIGSAIVFSLSRSAIIGLVVGMTFLFTVWRDRLRAEAAVVAVASAVAFRAITPGLLGTIRSLFLNFRSDPSIQGRTEDYAVVGDFIARRPWFGRGPRTFLVERYFALDNQYLYSLVTTGVVGVVSLVQLFLVPLCVARGVYRRGPDEETRHLGQALAAAVLVAAVTSFTFDSLSFLTFSGVLFVIIGAIGALRRLAPPAPTGGDAPPLRRLRRPPLPPSTPSARAAGPSSSTPPAAPPAHEVVR